MRLVFVALRRYKWRHNDINDEVVHTEEPSRDSYGRAKRILGKIYTQKRCSTLHENVGRTAVLRQDCELQKCGDSK